jgi:hypothetical protein
MCRRVAEPGPPWHRSNVRTTNYHMPIKIEVPSALIEFDRKRLRKVLRQAGQEVAAAARKLIRSAVGGGPRGASAPGQPPVSRSGVLASSISVKPSKSGLSVRILDAAYYSLFLETGAKGGAGRKGNRNRRGKPSSSRVLAPRPYLSKALEDREASLSERIKESISNDIAFKKMK